MHFEPIAFIKNSRPAPTDDHWASVISEIKLAENILSITWLTTSHPLF